MQKVAKNFKWFFVGVLFLATFFVWYAVYAESRQELEVYFLDVGQGDAILIHAPSGNQVLIDAGPNKAVLGELAKVMPFYDRTIDMVIESHPDSDHIGGLPEILSRYEVGAVMESGVNTDSVIYTEIEKLIAEKNIKKVLARRGTRVVLENSGYLDILFPDRDVAGMDTNDASIIAKLQYGGRSFLFTGDSPQKMEKYLVSLDKENLDADVLKVGHHGSKTSSSQEFLGYVSPEYAVISVGKENKYGHPHQEVLDRLIQFGAKILRTDELDLIKIKTDGESLIVDQN